MLIVAEHYPTARVIGTDLSPVQPHWTSPNMEFRIEDLEDENRPWTNIYDGADLIYARGLAPTLRNAQTFFSRVYECVENTTAYAVSKQR